MSKCFNSIKKICTYYNFCYIFCLVQNFSEGLKKKVKNSLLLRYTSHANRTNLPLNYIRVIYSLSAEMSKASRSAQTKEKLIATTQLYI